MRVHHIHVVAGSAILALTAPKRQGPAESIVEKAAATYEKTRTSKGTFEQVITNPLTGSTVRARGEFEQQRQPARFAFRFSDPKGDMIIGDGKWLWVYLPSSQPGQVIKMPMTEGGAGNLDLASRFFDSPKTRYKITDAGPATIGGKATRAVVLEPKAGGEPFSSAKVWLDTADGTLRQFETVELSGLKRQITITSVAANVPVRARSFTFTPPKGARIVDQKALGWR